MDSSAILPMHMVKPFCKALESANLASFPIRDPLKCEEFATLGHHGCYPTQSAPAQVAIPILSEVCVIFLQMSLLVKKEDTIFSLAQHGVGIFPCSIAPYAPGLTRFPTVSTLLNWSVMGQCSMAINRVFSTMQIVMARSTNGSITIKFTRCFTLSHALQQSQIKNTLANLYQHGGHFCLDSSSSGG